MTNTLTKTFEAPTGHSIRTHTRDGETWFAVTDICRPLGFELRRGASKHTRRLRKQDVRTLLASDFDRQLQRGSKGRGGLRPNSPLVAVNKSGLYDLILRSDKPEALTFRHWVTGEVLPSIEQTGGYQLADHGRTEMPLPAEIARPGWREFHNL